MQCLSAITRFKQPADNSLDYNHLLCTIIAETTELHKALDGRSPYPHLRAEKASARCKCPRTQPVLPP